MMTDPLQYYIPPQYYIPGFEELAGNEPLFFQDYFSKAPLLRRAALPGDPERLLSIRDLDEILHSKAIRFPHVQILRHGNFVPADEFTQSLQEEDKQIPGVIIPSRVIEYFRCGATITWAAVHHFRPNMRALASMLSEKFATQTGVTAVLTPANKQGFYPHCDPNDVFVIQLQGTKHWRVWPVLDARNGGALHFSASGDELGDPLIETTLNPGDILYLPTGAPHVAATGNEISLHLGAMVSPARWSELLKLIVAEIVDNDQAFWDVAHLSESRHEALAESLSSQVQALMGKLEKLDRGEAITRLLAFTRPAADLAAAEPLTDIFRADSISQATNVRRNPGAIIEDRGAAEKSERRRVSVDGRLYEMPASAVSALLRLDAGTELPAGEFLTDRPAESSARVVQQLCRIGALEMRG
jgi:lysine-specific demethylase/histidyl-hydroxylase NO66